MIRCDNEIRVIRNISLAFVLRTQQAFIESPLGQLNRLVADHAQEFRNANLVVLLIRLEPQARGFASLALRRVGTDDRQEFPHVLNLIEPLRRCQRAARVFDRSCQFHKHQAIEPEICKARIDRYFIKRTIGYGRDNIH